MIEHVEALLASFFCAWHFDLGDFQGRMISDHTKQGRKKNDGRNGIECSNE